MDTLLCKWKYSNVLASIVAMLYCNKRTTVLITNTLYLSIDCAHIHLVSNFDWHSLLGINSKCVCKWGEGGVKSLAWKRTYYKVQICWPSAPGICFTVIQSESCQLNYSILWPISIWSNNDAPRYWLSITLFQLKKICIFNRYKLKCKCM